MNALTKDFTDAVEQQFSKLNADVQEALKKAGIAECIAAELEQKMARGATGGVPSLATVGKQVVDSEHVKALADIAGSQPGRVKIDVKAITGASNSGGALDNAYRDADVNNRPRRALVIRNLMTVLNTTSGNVEYAEQTVRTNNAAPQAEGALKAESEYGWELRNLPVRTIAHWTKASVQILSDAPQLQSMIDSELLYGLALQEETQLLNGSGTGQNLTGLITGAAAYSNPLSLSAPTMIDTLGAAMLQVALADFVPNGIAIHPSDWMRIRLLKDADGKYLLGDPGEDAPPVLFGLPVVATKAMTIDKFLVGDFARAGTLYDREGANVQLSTEDGDNFIRNMVTIRAEERLALAIKQATALAYGDFGNVT